jgi:hypothetical protein
MIPADTIKRARAVSCIEIIARRGHRLRRGRKEHVGPCPVCDGTDRFAINLRKNVWNCRSCGKGGGPIDLIRHLDGSDFRGAIEALTGERARDRRGTTTIQPAPVKRCSNDADGERGRIKAAGEIWRASKPLLGTIAATYLESRSIDLDHDLLEGGSLRFHPSCPFGSTLRLPALIGLFTGIEDNKPHGIHRTALKPDGSGKAIMPDGRPAKRMLGIATGCAIRLDVDDLALEGLHVGEGIETCLSARKLGFRPTWALGSAGAIGRLQVILDCDGKPAIEALTLLEEYDKSGANAKAIAECGERWAAAGCEVLTIKPIGGGDCNDAVGRLSHG